MGQYFIPREYHPIDEIRLVYEDGILVGWYRPDIDPEIEELKAELETVKSQMEYIMGHPEDRCLFCAKRDAECRECDPAYIGTRCESCG